MLRPIGGSYDWTREALGMNQNLFAAVVETFCRLHVFTDRTAWSIGAPS